jgi:hypothetical protein
MPILFLQFSALPGLLFPAMPQVDTSERILFMHHFKKPKTELIRNIPSLIGAPFCFEQAQFPLWLIFTCPPRRKRQIIKFHEPPSILARAKSIKVLG